MLRRITARFVLLIATAAVAPLVIYGFVSITSLWTGTRASVREGNRNVATRAAGEIALYIDNGVGTLRSIGMEMRETGLQKWQQERILRNHVLEFPELREISLFDEQGGVIATSRLDAPRVGVPGAQHVSAEGVYLSPIAVDDDLLPTVTLAVRVTDPAGWVVASVSLEQLWRMVDSIRIGEQGYAMLITSDDRLIAHGDPDEKRLIARGEGVADAALVELLRDRRDPFRTYVDRRGRELIAAAARVEPLGWTVIVEQPTAEAYAVALGLERQLFVAIGLALLATILVGFLWGRTIINRIFILMRGTQAIAEGRWTERVHVGGRDELRQLGDAFNSMAAKLVELQENVRRQERQAMFGKVVAGLVHDLSHPIMNVGNASKLLMREWDDAETRELFKKTVDREMGAMKQLLDDLRNIAKPQPLQRFPLELNRSVSEVVESMRAQAENARLTLRVELAPQPLHIEGDAYALGRVYRNLIQNAIEATPPGGLIVVATEAVGAQAQVRIYDTGKGIPSDRLATIFEDFFTTKHGGLGLGLAISRKIVEQLGGTVSVASEVGKGTAFVLEFPITDARPMPAAAAG
jgi:signal transduction histidine kinase